MSKIKYLKTEKNEEALHQLQLKEKKKHTYKTIKTFEKISDEANKNPEIKV